jgi:sulfate/thiosulfate-binding protein
MRRPGRHSAILLVAFGLLTAGCGVTGGGERLTLVAYSTPREAYEALIPAFQQTEAGRGIRFSQSYGSSGDQGRAVANGLAADVVALSLAPDMDRLVGAGRVAPDWDAGRHRGMVTESVVVLVTREGNPKNIRTWDDLVAPGVEVVTPNPFTSGGARWNVMAAYGAQIERGRSHEQAVDYLRRLFENVPVQDKSAREAIQTFVGGKGDAMIAYESEAINAQQKHQEIDYLVPDQTILIQNPIAVASRSRNPAAAEAFVEFARSPAAQRIFADKGYRPVNREVTAEFPKPPGLFTIEDLGGWDEVTRRFFDKRSGLLIEIERMVGVSVGR